MNFLSKNVKENLQFAINLPSSTFRIGSSMMLESPHGEIVLA